MSSVETKGPRSLLEGVTNFRDLGGYRTGDGRTVRTGLVYRSGALHAVTDRDLERLQEMGVRLAIDLRPAEERASEPTSAPFLEILSVPLLRGESTPDLPLLTDGEDYLRARYQEIFLERADCIGTILSALARADCPPAVIHCAAGKDRTGVISAAVLLAVGVDKDAVLDDYELTSQYEAAHRVEELAAKMSGNGLSPAVVAGLLGTSRSGMSDAIDEVLSRYGSFDDYLGTAAELASSDLDALRTRLTA